ncbi:phage regulatory protein Rha, partial [Haemophilus influenzae]
WGRVNHFVRRRRF